MNHKEICRSCAASFDATGGTGRVLINGDWFGPLCSTCHGKFIALAAQGGG